MQAEKRIKKIKTVDYTADIKFLFELHHEKISKKIMYLLPLLLIQAPDVKKQMVESYVDTEFHFCFSTAKRTFSQEYKTTVKNILKKAILDGFNPAEVEYLLWGFILQNIPKKQIEKLTFSHSFVDSTKLPSPEEIPDIEKLLSDLEALQARFAVIDGYQIMPRMDMVMASIVGPVSAGATSTLLIVPFSILMLLGVVALELYLFASAFFSESKEKNALALPILLFSVIIDSLLAAVTVNCLISAGQTRRKDRVDAKRSTNQALQGRLPDLVTVEVENEIRYMLPLFSPRLSTTEPLPPVSVSQSVQEEPAVEKKIKKKTRSSASNFMRFFQNDSVVEGVSSTSPKDIIKLDEVVYRRLYNHNKKPTSEFVGYTEKSLWELTQHDNHDAFKALLDAPNFVPPKGHNGFVEMKKTTSPAAHFKAKVARSDVRLLFSPPKDAKVNGEKVHLYCLSGSKTHKQFGRQ
jgi:hypothetical protein